MLRLAIKDRDLGMQPTFGCDRLALSATWGLNLTRRRNIPKKPNMSAGSAVARPPPAQTQHSTKPPHLRFASPAPLPSRPSHRLHSASNQPWRRGACSLMQDAAPTQESGKPDEQMARVETPGAKMRTPEDPVICGHNTWKCSLIYSSYVSQAFAALATPRGKMQLSSPGNELHSSPALGCAWPPTLQSEIGVQSELRHGDGSSKEGYRYYVPTGARRGRSAYKVGCFGLGSQFPSPALMSRCSLGLATLTRKNGGYLSADTTEI